jgi:hypothetical protein
MRLKSGDDRTGCGYPRGMSSSPVKMCPVCGVEMDKRAVASTVEVDFCQAHGIWLDRGELEALLERGDARQIAEGIAKRFGSAIVHGAGFTTGGRLINGIIDSVLGKR